MSFLPAGSSRRNRTEAVSAVLPRTGSAPVTVYVLTGAQCAVVGRIRSGIGGENDDARSSGPMPCRSRPYPEMARTAIGKSAFIGLQVKLVTAGSGRFAVTRDALT